MGMNNYSPTEEDINVWLYMADANQDGRVSLEEYECLIIRSLRNAGIKIE